MCVTHVCWSGEAQPILYPDPIWVDVDNTSGTEDGSERYPFNTIAEGITAAVTHTIQVRPGVYFESVELPDGVKLIGSGSDSTILSPGPGGMLKGLGGLGAG